jgi:hypothetical protein
MYFPRFGTAILLNATNYTLVDLSNVPTSTIALQCRTAVDVYLATTPTPGQAYWTLKASLVELYDFGGLPIGAKRSANLVTNGTFTGGTTGWTIGAAWQYATNTAEKFAAGTNTLSQATCLPVTANIYELVYTISGYSTDTITASFGGVNGVARGADGTFKEYMKATDSTSVLTFTPTNTNRCKIDDVAAYILTGNMLFAKAATGTPYLEISYLV